MKICLYGNYFQANSTHRQLYPFAKVIMMKSFDELLRARKEIEEQILKLNGVTGMDIGIGTIGNSEKENAKIIVYVANKTEILSNKTVPEEIDGFPVEIVERRFVLH